MTRLIGQVLDASRLQTGGGLQMQFVDTDVVQLVDDLLDESRTAYPGVTMQPTLPVALPARADPDRLAQLFANLISNARHHGTAGDPVLVRLAQEGDQVVFEVRNTAPPIADALAPNLFSAFKPQATPNVRNKGGLGLGLHIAEAIALGHGGTLRYRYEAPHVVFSVRLPLNPPVPV